MLTEESLSSTVNFSQSPNLPVFFLPLPLKFVPPPIEGRVQREGGGQTGRCYFQPRLSARWPPEYVCVCVCDRERERESSVLSTAEDEAGAGALVFCVPLLL